MEDTQTTLRDLVRPNRAKIIVVNILADSLKELEILQSSTITDIRQNNICIVTIMDLDTLGNYTILMVLEPKYYDKIKVGEIVTEEILDIFDEITKEN